MHNVKIFVIFVELFGLEMTALYVKCILENFLKIVPKTLICHAVIFALNWTSVNCWFKLMFD